MPSTLLHIALTLVIGLEEMKDENDTMLEAHSRITPGIQPKMSKIRFKKRAPPHPRLITTATGGKKMARKYKTQSPMAPQDKGQ